MNLVSLQLVKQALANGVLADYVLFDSWYSSPKMFYELTKLGLNGVTAWACLNGPAKFTINIADGNIQLKHYTSDCKLQNISPSKLTNIAASLKHMLGTKNSSFAWYLWPIGPGKMTTWYWQRLSYPFSHKRSFNYTPEDGKLRITLKLPSNTCGSTNHKFKIMTGFVAI